MTRRDEPVPRYRARSYGGHVNARDSLRSGRSGALHRPSVLDAHALTRTSLTRHRGGIFSPTVGRIHTSEGALRTDLVRLSPDVDAYSLDAHAESPRDLAHYRVTPWEQAAPDSLRDLEKAVVWILVNSYPTLDTSTLSDRLRRAGHDIGAGDIPIHEAIAATQAALWSVSSGILPDRGDAEAIAEAVRRARIAPHGTLAGPAAPLLIPLHVPSAPRVGGYRLAVSADDVAIDTRLERSTDGVAWTEVPTSRAIDRGGSGMRVIRKGLGVGATISGAASGVARGYPHYRLRVTPAVGTRVRVHDVDLDLIGCAGRANSRRLLALYDHLREGAIRAEHAAASPLIGPRSALSLDDRPLGPFLINPTRVRAARVSATVAGLTVPVVDAHGRDLAHPIPGSEFFVDLSGCGTSGRLNLTVDVEADWRHSGRILVGASRNGERSYTPLALAVREPESGSVHREVITWRARADRQQLRSVAVAR